MMPKKSFHFTLFIRPISALCNPNDRPTIGDSLFSRLLFHLFSFSGWNVCSVFITNWIHFVFDSLLLLLHLRRPSTVFALSPHFAIITRLNCSRWRCRVQSSICCLFVCLPACLPVCVHFYVLLNQPTILLFFSLSLYIYCAWTWFSAYLFSQHCAQVSFDGNHWPNRRFHSVYMQFFHFISN